MGPGGERTILGYMLKWQKEKKKIEAKLIKKTVLEKLLKETIAK